MTEYIVIFDLDGTLLNTLDDLHICFNYAIEKSGYPKRTIKEIRSFVGNGIRKAIERALPSDVSTDEINKIVSDFKIYYIEHMLEHTKPYDGIIDMLHELKQKGCKIGVVSNKYDDAVKKLCKMYFGDLVEYAVGEGYGIARKPAPDGLNKCINELSIGCKNIIYIGDSEVDIQTAKNANIPCISVLWGFKDKDFLIKNGAKIFAEKPKDIIKIIEKKIYLE
ncbi:HAD family hydrolase [bacterium]|nr:HAD family hydrolase [bacterium]